MPERASVQSAGAVASCGSNGAEEFVRPKRVAAFATGSRMMLSAAEAVLPGGIWPTAALAAKSLPQAVASPAVPPGELTQAARMFASELIVVCGAVAFGGRAGPGI